jgi:hypothetical protein
VEGRGEELGTVEECAVEFRRNERKPAELAHSRFEGAARKDENND